MSYRTLKRAFWLFAYILGGAASASGQDTIQQVSVSERRTWFMVLPLRFTHLQDNNTMLSGIKAGRVIRPRWSVALSVYHSFYLNSFKARANLSGFRTQPRLFINCVGMEVQYDVYARKAFNANIQLLAGWGFLKYDLKDQDFRSRPVHYLALEPSLNTEFNVAPSTFIGVGLGYRPIWGRQAISYTSDVSNGSIPVTTALPNGILVLLNIKGYL